MSEEKPNRIDQTTEGSQNLYRRPERPKRAEVKPLQVLESVSNQAGEVFNSGDKILVTPPWGGKAIAEIASFYQDDSGNAWARYSSTESRSGWTWEGGCMLAALLVKTE